MKIYLRLFTYLVLFLIYANAIHELCRLTSLIYFLKIYTSLIKIESVWLNPRPDFIIDLISKYVGVSEIKSGNSYTKQNYETSTK